MLGMSSPGGGRRLRDHVAEEVRVLLARHKMTGSALARSIGKKQTWISRRLTGEVPFDVDDIEAIAAYFNIEPGTLVARPADRSRYQPVASPARPATPAARTVIPAGSGARPGGDTRPNGRPQTGPAAHVGPRPVRPARLARAPGRM